MVPDTDSVFLIAAFHIVPIKPFKELTFPQYCLGRVSQLLWRKITAMLVDSECRDC